MTALEIILNILQWLVPTGGFGAVIIWLTNKNVRNAEAALKTQDAYKVMYENVSKTVIDLQKENVKLYEAISELNETIRLAISCKHYDVCPIRPKLQKCTSGRKEGGRDFRPNHGHGQHRIRDENHDMSGSTDVGGETGDSDDEPP